jgi:hypothetical protein
MHFEDKKSKRMVTEEVDKDEISESPEKINHYLMTNQENSSEENKRFESQIKSQRSQTAKSLLTGKSRTGVSDF